MAHSYRPALNARAQLRAQFAPLGTFLVVWIGQLSSIIGSGMTAFALGVYVYQQTGSATRFALIALCNMLPRVVLSPLAGALADRWDRRQVMILSDAIAALSSLLLLVLLALGQLEVGWIYAATALNATGSAFEVPAYNAAATTLAPKAQVGRVSGLMQLADALGQIVAPFL